MVREDITVVICSRTFFVTDKSQGELKRESWVRSKTNAEIRNYCEGYDGKSFLYYLRIYRKKRFEYEKKVALPLH